MTDDATYMALALDLSADYRGTTGVMPAVGCVLVKEGKVIATGVTQPAGHHGEVNAILKAEAEGHSLKGATAYVVLEPCTIHENYHTSCSDLLIQKKIARVVVGTVDPYEEVNGRGIENLKQNGIQVDLLTHN